MCNFVKAAGIGAIVLASLVLGGCVGYQQRSENKTSLVEFLYPEKTGYVETSAIPQLTLPLRVGVAFTPSTLSSTETFTAREKQLLAEEVIKEFDTLSFVDSITLIPSGYLRRAGSFSNLEQLQQLFGVDVIVLLSYDQSVVTTQDLAALSYWTIVGAYLIPGEKNDTQTLLDAAVYDIASRKLLFRAPGTSVVKSRDTLISNAERRRENSIEGFQLAAADLTKNLATELDVFKQRVQDSPAQYSVAMRSGYSGSGSNDGYFVLLAWVLLFMSLLQAKKPGKYL
jgi:rhombotail lipoprotein